jgi:hypothetical protein
MLCGARRLPVVGTRVFRQSRCGHVRPSRGVSVRIGTPRARRGVRVADFIALVNDRLGPRLSLRCLTHRPLAGGSAIPNIVTGSKILPIGAQILPVRAKVGPVSL